MMLRSVRAAPATVNLSSGVPPSGWREVTLSGDAERGESNFAALAVDTLCKVEMRETTAKSRCEKRGASSISRYSGVSSHCCTRSSADVGSDDIKQTHRANAGSRLAYTEIRTFKALVLAAWANVS